MKRCSKCGEAKEETEFNVFKDDLQAYCRDCNSEYLRENWRKYDGQGIEPLRLSRWYKPDDLIDGYTYKMWMVKEKNWHLEKGTETKIVKKDGKISLYLKE